MKKGSLHCTQVYIKNIISFFLRLLTKFSYLVYGLIEVKLEFTDLAFFKYGDSMGYALGFGKLSSQVKVRRL